MELESVNQGSCILSKEALNQVVVSGATPNGVVAVVAGFGLAPTILESPPCAGLELGVSPWFLLGVLPADSNGNLNSPLWIPSFGNIASAHLQVVDIGSCTVNEASQHPLTSGQILTNDFDEDGVVNCDDNCDIALNAEQ